MRKEGSGDKKKIGVVMGAMARVEQNCSEKEGTLVKGVEMAGEFRRAGYPKNVIKKGMERMGRKIGGVWSVMERLI